MRERVCATVRRLLQSGCALVMRCGICDVSARQSSAPSRLSSERSSPTARLPHVSSFAPPLANGERIEVRGCSGKFTSCSNPHPAPLPRSGRGVPHTQLARDLCLFRVLPVIKQTSVYYAAIRSELKASGSPIPANDAWIAALARQHRMPIVTRDIHLDRVKNIERLASDQSGGTPPHSKAPRAKQPDPP